MKKRSIAIVSLSLMAAQLNAEIRLPNFFSDHMVLQREQANPIWGTAEAGASIELTIAGQSLSTQADSEGNWRADLPALEAGGPFEIRIVAGESEATLNDVLVGEVWFCSGQSNMEWPVNQSYGGEVEIVAANHPQIRLLSVGLKGTQELQDDIEGTWQVCSPETVAGFSAVGYYFGQYLNAALDIPIGLVDNAWGGSTAEAWVPTPVLESEGSYDDLLEDWEERVAAYDEAEYKEYVERFEAWVEGGFEGPQMDWNKTVHPIEGQHRPGNIYAGMLHPMIGYGMRGVIWYQGESNTGRAEQYKELFPLMVNTWREEWEQGDFPFYWVQLADHGEESSEPEDHAWAELRASQTHAMDVLENSGQAVIIDVGEGRDIHPRDKKTVASRLVRWPLAKQYGFDISYQSPRYKDVSFEEGKAIVSLDHISEQGLWSFDTESIRGFSIAGEDKKFVWAEAKILEDNRIKVWSDEVSEPVAVRYAWAMNPNANLFDRNGLPVTPFQTDDWEWVTAGQTK